MTLRKLKADRIFDGNRMWHDHVLVVEGSRIMGIIPEEEAGEDVEACKGILTPGFINAHCHLELSHLKGEVEEGTGLVNFLLAVMKARKKQFPGKMDAIRQAEKEMYHNGINGVADICNTSDATLVKEESNIRWHNLVEVLNFRDHTLEERWKDFQKIRDDHHRLDLSALLTPHAPYSVSPKTFSAINRETREAIISIHNQEAEAENELYQKGSGDFLKLYDFLGATTSPMPVSGKTSLQSWMPHFTEGQTIILVHNTFITEDDIFMAQEHASRYGLKLYYCTCPNANWYIERTLAPLDMLMKHDCNIIVGTDSYGSNHALDITSELKLLSSHFPHIDTATLLQWSTSTGAAALGWDDLGSFKKGNKPGILLLDETTFSVQRLA